MNKVRLFFVVPFCMLVMQIRAQDCHVKFRSPVSQTTILSGSYGEPRTKHFHAGIDFKQKRGIPYDTIFAVEDGYISRISVQPDGYGNGLYINHPCNFTSVYGHLFDFAPWIRERVNKELYKIRQYSINYEPDPDSLAIKKGDFIGILGSTGRSSGPHLHFEIRKTSSETPINPALKGIKPSDEIPPVIAGIMLYELSPDDQELKKQYYPISTHSENNYSLKDEVLITGAIKAGIGIRTYDQMNGASNHNGIYSLEMRIDGFLTFSFKLDSIPFHKSKYIHSHMDYEEKVKNNYVTKCFINPGNGLSIYHTNSSKGTFFPFEFRKSKIEIIARDIEGNSSTIAFSVLRNDEKITPFFIKDNSSIRILPSDSMSLKLENTIITFDKGTFCQPAVITLPRAIKDTVDFTQNRLIPTFRHFRIERKMIDIIYPKHKYVFLSNNDKNETFRHRTRWENDSSLVTFVNSFEQFRIGIDTVSPTISVISIPGNTTNRLKFSLHDNFEPMQDSEGLVFQIFLDGQWILAHHDAKSKSIWFDLDQKRTSSTHEVKILAVDKSKNRTELTRSFIY